MDPQAQAVTLPCLKGLPLVTAPLLGVTSQSFSSTFLAAFVVTPSPVRPSWGGLEKNHTVLLKLYTQWAQMGL